MKRKIVSTLLALFLSLQLAIPVMGAESYSNFSERVSYEGQFSDVMETDWFAPYVEQGFEYGLIKGSTETQFAPNGQLTIAQCITIAVRLHSIFMTGEELDVTGDSEGQWYTSYVNYAVEQGIIPSEYNNYDVIAMRHEVASIFSRALPQGAISQIREVEDNAIPDVSMEDGFAPGVYALYRAGVLSGSDDAGSFYPYSSIKRSEIATICVRIADPTKRSSEALTFKTQSQLEEPQEVQDTVVVEQPQKTEETVAGNQPQEAENTVLTAKQIAEKCSPAVFYIETYSFNGSLRGSGSGFFISEDGLAVTNCHVVTNSIHVKITTHDGTVYDDVEIIDYDGENDLVLLRVKGGSFPYLEMGNSDTVKQGEKVYAIGSPLGFDNTLSEGIISNPNRIMGDMRYIQISVPIDHGSSGGALIDETGKVIGVTSSGIDESTADLNFAIPILDIKGLNQQSAEGLYVWDCVYYPGFSQALDFEYFSGLSLVTIDVTPISYHETYDLSEFYDVCDLTAADCFYELVYQYGVALKAEGFTETYLGDSFYLYDTETESIFIDYNWQDKGIIDVYAGRKVVYFEGFDTVGKLLPDFGWYTQMEIFYGPTEVDEAIMYVYDWSEHYSFEEFGDVLFSYFDSLELLDYEYLGYSCEDSMEMYQFANDELWVFIVHEAPYVTIAVYEI